MGRAHGRGRRASARRRRRRWLMRVTSWVTTTAARPCAACWATRASRLRRPTRSRSESASSSSSRPVSWAMTRAMCTRLRSPPDSDVTGRSRRSSSSWATMAASTARASSSGDDAPRQAERPHPTTSATVKPNETWVSCVSRARRRASSRVLSSRTSCPPIRALPLCGVSSPDSTPSSVDLPEPLRPTTAVTAPPRIGRSVGWSRKRSPARTLAPRSSAAGGDVMPSRPGVRACDGAGRRTRGRR